MATPAFTIMMAATTRRKPTTGATTSTVTTTETPRWEPANNAPPGTSA